MDFFFYKKFKKKYFSWDEKTILIVRNAFQGFFFKGISIFCSFLIVPLLLSILGSKDYGIWITISSFVSWFNIFNLGIGNGLRNTVARFIALNKYYDASKATSSAYAIVFFIAFSIGFIFIFFAYFIEFYNLFNLESSYKDSINLVVPILFIGFLIKLILNLISSLLYSIQKSSLVELLIAIQSSAVLVSVFFLGRVENSLLSTAIIYSLIPVLILLLAHFICFSSILSKIKLSLKNIDIVNGIGLLKKGAHFFIIQISALILYSTDNYLIAVFSNVENVTLYSICFKYFSVISLIWGLILAPYWSMVTKAIAEKEFTWVSTFTRKLVYQAFLLSFFAFCMLLLSDVVFGFWVKDILVPNELKITMFFYVVVATFSAIYGNAINGFGKLKILMYLSFVLALVNIPLSYVLSVSLDLGIIGVPIATIICMLLSGMIAYIQYIKLINNLATGLWNR